MPSIEAPRSTASSSRPQGKAVSVTASLIDRNDAALPADVDGRGDFALLPAALWEKLFPSSTSSQHHVVAVTFPAQQSPEAAGKASVIQYAATCLQEGQAQSQEHIFLSSFPSGASPQPMSATVTSLRPLPLSSLILSTSSRSLVKQASSSAFRDSFAGTLVRQGHLLHLSGGRFRAVQAEPVLQGQVERTTQVLVVFDANFDDEEEKAGREESLQAGAEEDVGEALAGLSIDERFLANSVIEEFDEPDEDRAHQIAPAAVNGYPDARAHDASVEAWPIVNRQALTDPISEWQSRQHGLCEVDEESAILLSEERLAAIGGFDGDCAVIEIAGQARPRLVRIFTTSHSSSRAYLPPSLLQNLHDPATYAPNPRASPRLLIFPISQARASVAGPSAPLSCPLPIPFADSLTIARVPSSLSVNRTYQPLFLDALRQYFEGRKRIVREGDIIAVGVDKGNVRWVKQKSTDDEGKEGKDQETQQDEEPVDFNLSSVSSRHAAPTDVVHFHVSSLTAELNSPPSDTARDPDYEVREAARIGTLGAVVDPSLTKMVQTGVAGRRVADSSGWLGLASSTPPLPSGNTPLSSPGSPFARLCQLISATLLPSAANYGLYLSVLLKGARGSGKKTVVQWAAKQTGVHLIDVNCFDVLGDSDTHTEGVLRARFEAAASCGPAILLLRNIDALARKSQQMETGQEPAMSNVLRDCMRKLREGRAKGDGVVSVFGTTSDADKVPNGILAAFKHEVAIEAPNEAERLEMLQSAVAGSTLSPDASLKDMATQTAALVAADLVDLISRARLASTERVRKALATSRASARDIQLSGSSLTGADFSLALSSARSNYSESIGAPKIPSVTWDDVGGLASVKHDILDTIQLPLEHPELFASGLKKRSGILLYGPPGTGKTLLAKAVATSCSLNFFSVKGPELLNMYIGESEANVRRVFQRARDAKPCVIFFDELDSVAPKRGNQGDSGGVMDRIVSQLLAELDGMSSGGGSGGGDVFVIGATNRPDLLDPALLRPGRFDKMLYLSVSETHAAQLNILEALTRKFRLEDDVRDLGVIAEQCPFNLTGADFYALCSDAMLKAMTRKAGEVDERIRAVNAGEVQVDEKHPKPMTAPYYLSELASPEEINVRVNRRDFEEALRELVPSVSEAEMEHYRRVQGQFSGPPKDESKLEENEQKRRQQEEERDGMLAGLLEAARSGAGADGSGSRSAAAAGSSGPRTTPLEPYVVPQEPAGEGQEVEAVVSPPHPSAMMNGQAENGKGKGKGKCKGKARAQD